MISLCDVFVNLSKSKCIKNILKSLCSAIIFISFILSLISSEKISLGILLF